MLSTNKYFHDRLVLLLLSVNAFFAVLTSLSVLLRLQGGGEGFIVQYRGNLGVSAFKTGSVDQILSFVAFVLVIFAIHAVLSWKTYRIRRELSITILGLGTLLLILAVIVSDALLTLR
jgi:hypothetical protein